MALIKLLVAPIRRTVIIVAGSSGVLRLFRAFDRQGPVALLRSLPHGSGQTIWQLSEGLKRRLHGEDVAVGA